MPRSGWSGQEPYQPYPTDPEPHVTDQDFSYIPSYEIVSYHFDPGYSALPPIVPVYEEDDVLHVVLANNREYQLQFPAYSIGDGKLLVGDIQKRIAFLRDIPDHRTPYISLFYKGTKLRNPGDIVRVYGCKNHSELYCIIPGRFPDEIETEQHQYTSQSSGSESDPVIVTDDHGRITNTRRLRRKSSVKHSRSPSASGTSPQIPPSDMGAGSSKPRPISRHNRETPSPAMKKLEEIAQHFETSLRPLCEEFAMSPPADKQKREDEHKKLEEATMQQVLLKLDAVQTDGDEQVRARRRELVGHVQAVLKMIDSQK